MKERPILFSGEMVKAILDGRKTMTRRVVKPQPTIDETLSIPYFNFFKPIPASNGVVGCPVNQAHLYCPYGQPGDALWVRETWRQNRETDFYPRIAYRADGQIASEKWRPSIFMPRWASRILLEITDIRVERLQEITEEDAISEGVLSSDYEKSYRYAFSMLWDSINEGRGYGWNINPWTWVISFKRLK